MLRKLGKYELLEEIGHGGMATVYRARDVNLDREVAVKVMHPHLRKTPEARARFTREARSVARLRHPNVLEIYDYGGENEEESFIAAELLTGPTLKDFVESGQGMPAEIAACFAILVARALAAAHDKGIIHRDVKPENVLLHEARTVKLTDFGIAQMVDSQSFTATGQLLGSPGHMAPEQIEGGDIDQRTDVFSLGTVLYFLALRRLPFTGRNPHQVLKRIADGEYPDPLRMDPSIGSRLATLIDRAMAKDPSERFATAREIEAALDGFLAEMDISAPEETLVAYLADPVAVGETLRQRTLARLLRLAREAVAAGERTEALRHCNRILALDDGNAEALELVEKLGRERKRWPMVAGAGVVLALGALVAFAATRPEDADPVVAGSGAADAGVEERPGDPDLGPAEADAGQVADAATDAKPAAQVRPATAMVRPVRSRTRDVRFAPEPSSVAIAIDEGEFRNYGPGFFGTELDVGTHRFRVRAVGRASTCCEELDQEIAIRPGEGELRIPLALAYAEASLFVRVRGASGQTLHGNVTVAPSGRAGGASARTQTVFSVPMSEADQLREVTVRGDFGEVSGSVRLVAGAGTKSVDLSAPP